MSLVVDASAAVALLVDDGPVGRACEAAVEAADALAAPALMPFEAGNVLRREAARGAIEPAFAALALADLGRLEVELAPFAALGGRAWELRDNLTLYDASYVALAELLGASLLTLDRRILRAPDLRCEIVVAGGDGVEARPDQR